MQLGTYGIQDLVGGLGAGGRCAMWVKNRDYRLRRRRRGGGGGGGEHAGRTCRIGITARYSQRRFGCWVFRAFGGGDEREEIVEVKLRASVTWGRRQTARQRRN